MKTIPNVTTKTPEECTSITDVRNEIDHIDQTIVRLIGQRFGYVKEVMKYKDGSASSIEATDRRTAMMADRRTWAKECGLCPDAMEDIFDRLVCYFIEEEKKMVGKEK